jgi:HEPN domain-containing protein
MAREGPRTAAVPRREALPFLRKAEEFVATAKSALRESRQNSAGLESVHATISACDALTIDRLELRCRGEDHREVLRLIDRIEAARKAGLPRQVLQVLAVKNLVEYGGEDLSEAQASKVVAQAERVVHWVRGAITE